MYKEIFQYKKVNFSLAISYKFDILYIVKRLQSNRLNAPKGARLNKRDQHTQRGIRDMMTELERFIVDTIDNVCLDDTILVDPDNIEE